MRYRLLTLFGIFVLLSITVMVFTTKCGASEQTAPPPRISSQALKGSVAMHIQQLSDEAFELEQSGNTEKLPSLYSRILMSAPESSSPDVVAFAILRVEKGLDLLTSSTVPKAESTRLSMKLLDLAKQWYPANQFLQIRLLARLGLSQAAPPISKDAESTAKQILRICAEKRNYDFSAPDGDQYWHEVEHSLRLLWRLFKQTNLMSELRKVEYPLIWLWFESVSQGNEPYIVGQLSVHLSDTPDRGASVYARLANDTREVLAGKKTSHRRKGITDEEERNQLEARLTVLQRTLADLDLEAGRKSAASAKLNALTKSVGGYPSEFSLRDKIADMIKLAEVNLSQNKTGESEKTYRETISLLERTTADNWPLPNTPSPFLGLADICFARGRVKEAIVLYKKALVFASGHSTPKLIFFDNWNKKKSCFVDGQLVQPNQLQLMIQRLARSLNEDKNWLLAKSSKFSADSSDGSGGDSWKRNYSSLRQAQSALASSYIKEKDFEQAEKLTAELLQAERSIFSPKRLEINKYIVMAAEVKQAQGKRAEAYTLFQQALRAYKGNTILPEDGPVAAYTGIAEIEEVDGQEAKAAESYRDAIIAQYFGNKLKYSIPQDLGFVRTHTAANK